MNVGRVRWDEENLKDNDESRCATMTIDEPPTPFNFEYCEDEDDEDEADVPEHADVLPTSSAAGSLPAEVKADDGAKGLSFADQWAQAGMDEVLSDPSNLRPSFEDMTEEERQAARIAFEKNRKKHYDMGNILKAPIPQDEEDEDDEEVAKDSTSAGH